MSRRRRVLTVLASGLSLVGAACGHRPQPPIHLVDGSTADEVPVTLEGVDVPAVLNRTRVVDLARYADVRVTSCLRQRWSARIVARAAVVRIGTAGSSVTFGSPEGREIYGCDSSSGASRRTAWCGLAFGRRVGHRLSDPRLDLGGCRTREGHPIAFAWVEPGPRTRFVLVRRPSFAEVYEVAGDLPIRITTSDNVDVARSRARFPVSEHSSSGDLLRRYELDANVAG